MSPKIAVPRERTVNVCGHVGWNVSGMTAASAYGSRPDTFEGMHVSSFQLCHMVDSQSPFWPLSQLFGSMLPGHAAPMLHTFGCLQMHENTDARPVGLPELQPGLVGIGVPSACVRAKAEVEPSAIARPRSEAASFMGADVLAERRRRQRRPVNEGARSG